MTKQSTSHSVPQMLVGFVQRAGKVLKRVGKALAKACGKGVLAIQRSKHPKRNAVLACLVGVYLLLGLVFSLRFLPGTRINGRDASLASSASLARGIEADMQGGQIVVKGDDVELTISDEQIGLSFDRQAFKQATSAELAGFAWPLKVFADKSYTVDEGITYDKDALTDLVTEAVTEANEGKEPPADATVVYNETTHEFEVQEEQYGTAIDERLAIAQVIEGVAGGKRTIALGDDIILQPTVYASDRRMSEAVRQANDIASTKLSLSVDGEPYSTIDQDLIRSWISINEDYEATGDVDLITYWTRGALSSQIDTVGSLRTYNRPDGKKVEVAGGTYGWNVDGAALAQTIADHLKSETSGTIDIPFIQRGAMLVKGGADWGWRYVDVDITEQMVRFYDGEKGMVWSSPCVTGDVLNESETVLGVYYVEKKESPSKLVGPDEDGDDEPDWENDVEYWIQFFYSYGIHDAPWRAAFGETIYQYAGSHGCVNLPSDAAATLYDMLEEGDPVVVHE